MASPLTRPPSLRWLLAFALLILVAHEGHEIVHTWTGRAICGAFGTRDFNVWTLAPGCGTRVAIAVGPLFSWLVMWTGVALLLHAPREGTRWVGLALLFATNPLGRMLPALVGGGDEGVVAYALTGSRPTARALVAVVALLVVLPPVVIAWRSLAMPRRGLWFTLLFLGAILVTGPLLFAVGNHLLAAGVLARSGPLGAPLLVELVTAVSIALFAWRARDLTNDSDRDARSAATAVVGAA